MAKGLAGGRVRAVLRGQQTHPAETPRRRALHNRRRAMATARAGKAAIAEARFSFYDEAIDAVLRAQGLAVVSNGQVETVAGLVVDWMDQRSVGYSPAYRTIRRHLERRGLVAAKAPRPR